MKNVTQQLPARTLSDIDGEVSEDSALVLQNIVFARAEQFATAALFTRWPGGNGRLAETAGLSIEPGEVASFDTYYNAFSFQKWRQVAAIGSLGLRLKGVGRVRLRIAQYGMERVKYPDIDRDLDLGLNEVIWLDELPEPLETLAIAFALEVPSDLGRVLLQGGEWLTRDKPCNEVRLATVMTTFRREVEATRTYQKYRDEILPSQPGSHLFVVDNGATLDLSSTDRITVVPNMNLGGAGGFTRGLIEAKASGRFTHVLFMDDDANCLPESITRTIALLSYARGERIAVAGAMLLEERPWIQYEHSATFVREGNERSFWISQGAHRDLTNWRVCINNDRANSGNYGGWWFFAFALKDVKSLPFPFFVRGDDTDFSLKNDLKIATLNGIATTCPSLGSKSSNVTSYLSERSWLSISLMHSDVKRVERMFDRLLRRAHQVNRDWNYGLANALLLAIEDALAGPGFFDENPSAIARIKEIAEFIPLREVTSKERTRLVKGSRHKPLGRIFDRPVERPGASANFPIVLVPRDIAPRRIYSQGSPFKAEKHDGGLYLLTRQAEIEKRLDERISRMARSRKKLIARALENYRAGETSVRSFEAWARRLGLEGAAITPRGPEGI